MQAGTTSSITDREEHVALGESPSSHLPRPAHASVPCTRLSPLSASQPQELPATHVPVAPGGEAILPGILSKAEPRQPSPPRPLPSLSYEPCICRSRECMSPWHTATLLSICPKYIESDLLSTTPWQEWGPCYLTPPLTAWHWRPTLASRGQGRRPAYSLHHLGCSQHLHNCCGNKAQ